MTLPTLPSSPQGDGTRCPTWFHPRLGPASAGAIGAAAGWTARPALYGREPKVERGRTVSHLAPFPHINRTLGREEGI
jgi:hypothetical protein